MADENASPTGSQPTQKEAFFFLNVISCMKNKPDVCDFSSLFTFPKISLALRFWLTRMFLISCTNDVFRLTGPKSLNCPTTPMQTVRRLVSVKSKSVLAILRAVSQEHLHLPPHVPRKTRLPETIQTSMRPKSQRLLPNAVRRKLSQRRKNLKPVSRRSLSMRLRIASKQKWPQTTKKMRTTTMTSRKVLLTLTLRKTSRARCKLYS